MRLTCHTSTRIHIPFMCFMATCMMNLMKSNISIILLAMVVHNPEPKDFTACPNLINMTHHNNSLFNRDYGVRYNWSSMVQSQLQAAYFYGYGMTCAFGGYLAGEYGPKSMITVTLVTCSILTILSPFIVEWHWSVLLLNRFLLGFFGGPCFPALHSLIANWAPPHEQGRFMCSLTGNSLGIILSWPIIASIIEYMGWQWSFYLPGFVVLIWTLWWIHDVYDSPVVHPKISDEERYFILSTQGFSLTYKGKGLPPYRQMFTSRYVYAFILLHVSVSWSLYITITDAPKYFAEALGYSLPGAAILGTAPFMARFVGACCFGIVGDYRMIHSAASLTNQRNTYVVFAHLLPAFIILFIAYIKCNPMVALAILMITSFCNGGMVVTSWLNGHDLAPNYVGTLYGIANMFASCWGILMPFLTKALHSFTGNKLLEWHWIFLAGAVLSIFGGFVFIILGTSEQQPWNDPDYNSMK